jgi:hypothetical protein
VVCVSPSACVLIQAAGSKMVRLLVVVIIALCIGLAYTQSSCPNNCYSEWGQGECVTNNTCNCTNGFYGDDCSLNWDDQRNWDSIYCHKGRIWPNFYHDGWQRYCVCPPGWHGIDCSRVYLIFQCLTPHVMIANEDQCLLKEMMLMLMMLLKLMMLKLLKLVFAIRRSSFEFDDHLLNVLLIFYSIIHQCFKI